MSQQKTENYKIQIARELEPELQLYFKSQMPRGLILAGMVGCGKTTLVESFLAQVSEYDVFRFTGDDTLFRFEVAKDSKYLYNYVRTRTQKRAILFVDEAQKSEELFDALKYAFDQGQISFIVSGSNPQFLKTEAQRRLQRRAELWLLTPLSLPEIFSFKQIKNWQSLILEKQRIFFDPKKVNSVDFDLQITSDILEELKNYVVRGGFPLAYLSYDTHSSLYEIQKVVERGFEPILSDTDSLTDQVVLHLASRHSQEFTYQDLMRKTGARKRDLLNEVILKLIGHGYVTQLNLIFPGEARRSYLKKFYYTDPGIVSYLTGERDWDDIKGVRIEGLAIQRLIWNLLRQPYKAEYGYYKPYTVDKNGKVKYKDGEIDFVYRIGRQWMAVEVKASTAIENMDLSLLKEFVREFKLPYGIVLYGGVPLWDQDVKIIYWPYWGV